MWFKFGIAIILLYVVCGAVETLPSKLFVGIVLPEDQKGGPIDTGYRWGLKNLNSTCLIAESIYVKAGDSFRASKQLCRLLGTGIITILGGASDQDPSLEWKLYWTSARLDVPLFLSTPSFAQKQRFPSVSEPKVTQLLEIKDRRPVPEFAIRLSPTLRMWSQLLRELTKYLGLQSVAILYEDEKGLSRIQGLLREPSPVEHIIVRKVSPQTFSTVLSDVKGREIRHLVIDCKLSSLSHLLAAVEKMKMTDYKYHYILTNLDVRTMETESFIQANINVTAFQLVNQESKITQDKFSELKNFIQKEGNVSLFMRSVKAIPTETALAYDSVTALGLGIVAMDVSHEIVPQNLSCENDGVWKDGLSLFNYITSVDFKGLSGHVIFKEGERSSVKLDVIRLGPSGWKKVGNWTPEKKLNITKPRSFWDYGLINSTLTVTCVLEEPYVKLRQGTNLTGNARFEGFSVDLLKLIADAVGFNYVIDVVPDGKYGAFDSETGEWNGVIKQLTDKSVDLGIGALTITHSRELVIDFTKPFMHFGISILFRKPIRTETGVFTFLKPLALEIWLSVVVSYLLVSLTMFIVARFSPYEWSKQTTAMSYGVGTKVGVVRNQFTISNALWYPIGTLMQQGSDLNPKSTSTRIVGGFWWFFSIIMVSSYTANLAAYLTVQRLANPIESARDLVEQSEVTYGSLEAGTTMSYFRDSKIETYQKMWRFMESRKPSVFSKTYSEGVQRVLQGNYAFLMESTTIAYVQGQNCNLTQIGGLLNSKGYGIALPKGSPWKDKISVTILELQEVGVIRWYQDKWWSKRDPDEAFCNKEYKKDTTASALGVDSIGGIFIVLSVGLALAVSVAVLEFCLTSKKHANMDQIGLCTEMAQEIQFACKCQGPVQKPALIRTCETCKSQRSARSNTNTPLPNTPSLITRFDHDPDQISDNDEHNNHHEDRDNYGSNYFGCNIFSPAYEEQEGFGIRNRAMSSPGKSSKNSY